MKNWFKKIEFYIVFLYLLLIVWVLVIILFETGVFEMPVNRVFIENDIKITI